MRSKLLISTFLLLQITLFSQEKKQVQKLDTILIKSTRIDLPFKDNSRTINIITSETI